MIIPRAALYQNDDALVIITQAQTHAGFLVSTTPVFRHALGDPAAVIAGSLAKAKAHFVANHPDPDRAQFKALTQAVLTECGYRSWKSLEADMRHCRLDWREGQMVFEASHHGGSRGAGAGYQPHKPVRTVTVPVTATSEEIVQALQAAFALCTTEG